MVILVILLLLWDLYIMFYLYNDELEIVLLFEISIDMKFNFEYYKYFYCLELGNQFFGYN